METVIYPTSCDPHSILRFCSDVEQHKGIDKLNIDFSRMGRVEPFTMIYVAKIIREFNRSNKNTRVVCSGFKNKEYASNMAFFRAFGLKHGRIPNSTDGNSRFVPFTILRIKTIKEEASAEWGLEQNIIEKRSEHLAQILAQEETSDLVDSLTYSIREIMRNVYEHSQSKSLEYCAQYWPTYDRVEIAISDNGIGLKESLLTNPFMKIESDSDAIQQALMPAISSKYYKGIRTDRNNPWQNSGYGLYMISRLCRLGGSFLICSGDHGVLLDNNGKQHVELGHYCSGTVVRLVLNTQRLNSLSKMLDNFKNDGYEIAKKIKGVGMYEASSASKMLSRDFS